MKFLVLFCLFARFGYAVGGLEKVDVLLKVPLYSLEKAQDVSVFLTRLDNQVAAREGLLTALPVSRRLALAALLKDVPFTSHFTSRIAGEERDFKVREVGLRHELDLLAGKKLSVLAHLFWLRLKANSHTEHLAKLTKETTAAAEELVVKLSAETVRNQIAQLEEQIKYYLQEDLLKNPEHPGVAHVNYLKDLVGKAKAKLAKGEETLHGYEELARERRLEYRDSHLELRKLDTVLVHVATPEAKDTLVSLLNTHKPDYEPLVFPFCLPDSLLLASVESFVAKAQAEKDDAEALRRKALHDELVVLVERLKRLEGSLNQFVTNKVKVEVLKHLLRLDEEPDFKLFPEWPGSDFVKHLHSRIHIADFEKELLEEDLVLIKRHKESLGKQLLELRARLEELEKALVASGVTDKLKAEVLKLVDRGLHTLSFRSLPEWPGTGYFNRFDFLLEEAEKAKAEAEAKLQAVREERALVGEVLVKHNVDTLNLQNGLESFLDEDLSVDKSQLDLSTVVLPGETVKRDLVAEEFNARSGRLELLRGWLADDPRLVKDLRAEVVDHVWALKANPAFLKLPGWPGHRYLNFFLDLVKERPDPLVGELLAAVARLDELKKVAVASGVTVELRTEVLDLVLKLHADPGFAKLPGWPGHVYFDELLELVKPTGHSVSQRVVLVTELKAALDRLAVLERRVLEGGLTKKVRAEVVDLVFKLKFEPEFAELPPWPGVARLDHLLDLVNDVKSTVPLADELKGTLARLEELKGFVLLSGATDWLKTEVLDLVLKLHADTRFAKLPGWPGRVYFDELIELVKHVVPVVDPLAVELVTVKARLDELENLALVSGVTPEVKAEVVDLVFKLKFEPKFAKLAGWPGEARLDKLLDLVKHVTPVASGVTHDVLPGGNLHGSSA